MSHAARRSFVFVTTMLMLVSVLSPTVRGASLSQPLPPRKAGFLSGYGGGLNPTYANLAYATASPSEVLDIFLPTGSGPFPMLINIHGGGFLFGNKEDLDPDVTKAFLQAGYAVASIRYRLSGEAKFPAAVNDVKAAVRFLRAKAASFHLDPKQFVAFGQSAGANLASMLGTTAGVTALEAPQLGNAKVSSAVQAVINWFGQSDFLKMDEEAKQQGCSASDQTHHTATSVESLYLGAPINTVPALDAKANPLMYVTNKSAPTLLEKGNLDCTVPVAQSVLLYKALKAAGVPTQYVLLQGAGHGGPQFSNASNIQLMLSFLKKHLKQRSKPKRAKAHLIHSAG
jgi:acetyl esterase/lipase